MYFLKKSNPSCKKVIFRENEINFTSLFFYCMRLKIAISIIFLTIIGGIYTSLSLPFFIDTMIYKDYIIGYMPFIRKLLSILSILIAAYGANIALNLVLTKSFTSVIRSNTLAKKIFPLIHWAISIAVWILVVFFIL
jgi:hypothetical protein